jgi:hypothetical protein
MKDWAVSFIAAVCFVAFVIVCVREIVFLIMGVV